MVNSDVDQSACFGAVIYMNTRVVRIKLRLKQDTKENWCLCIIVTYKWKYALWFPSLESLSFNSFDSRLRTLAHKTLKPKRSQTATNTTTHFGIGRGKVESGIE